MDPKAIEEAAKDEPPPYLPTDKECVQGSYVKENSSPTDGGAVATAAAIAAHTSKDVLEHVVEEDAEDERQGSAVAAKAKSNSVSFADQDPSIWPTVYGKDDDMRAEQIDYDDFGMPEPSMEEFFHEQSEMVDPPLPGQTNAPVEKGQPTLSAAAPTALSLIPSKSNTKTKKPKFRTMSRKKK